MCGVRLVDRVLTDVLCDRVGVNFQIGEVMEVEITGKRKKGQPKRYVLSAKRRISNNMA